MDQPLWERIGELFTEARELSGERRLAFLKEHCGEDQELFQQVMSLLEASDKSGLLDSSPTISAFPVPQVVAGRFRIIRYIAEGGMGTVYEAEDLTLGDRIALKTIRPDIVSDPRAVERFKREISLGKKVTHPNVCRIHDLGVGRTEDGREFLFLTMQFLSGETLASRIRRGPMPTSEALPLVEDMTAALSAAHQAEVIHRDFKSGNVMLVNGSSRVFAVVTDFGLARQLHDRVSLTQTGMVGTVSYMAPEQIRGEELTPATDIYALGVVMYEMVTGELPFKGDSNVTIALKHLNEEPRPPREVSPGLEPRWQEAILDCLRKRPEERLQSAAEVKDAIVLEGTRLRKASVKRTFLPLLAAATLILIISVPALFWFHHESSALPAQKHIAVLPFENIGNDAASQAFSEGVVDSLTSKLSELERYQQSFWVVPSTDAKHINSLEDAYRKLNVTLAVTGSVQRTPKHVILNVNLVDAKNHKQLASRTINADLADLDTLQDQVWESVAGMIDLQVTPEAMRTLNAGGTRQPGAYELYEQGIGYLQRSADGTDRAIEVLGKALERDPQYALAYAGLGEAYSDKYSYTKDPQWIEKAISNGQHAVDLAPHLAPPHIALGKVYQRTGQFEKALTEFRAALQRDPGAIEAEYHIAEIYEIQGKFSEAEEAYKSVVDRRPGYPLGYSGLGTFYYRHGQFQKAADQFKAMIDLQPDNSLAYEDLGGTYIAMSRYKDAISVFNKGLSYRQTSSLLTNLGSAYMYLEMYPEAAAAMEEATKLDPHNDILWRNLGDSYRQLPSRAADATAAYEKALQAATEELRVNPNDTEVLSGIALYYAHLGQRRQAESFITRALKFTPKNSDVLFTSALVYEIIGHRDQAIVAIDEAVKAGYSVQDVEEEPELRGLRSDPRYRRWIKDKGPAAG